MASEWATRTAAALDPGSYHDITMDEIADALDAAYLSGAKAMQERAAEWLDGGEDGDGFDPVLPLSRHMNLDAMSREGRAHLEGVTDAILAGASSEIRAIDPTTLRKPE